MSAFYYALLAALTWAIAPLLEKWALGRLDPVPGLLPRSLGVLIGILVFYPFIPSWRAGVLGMGLKPVLALAAAGFLASILGQYFAYNAMKRAEVSLVSPVAASWPLLVLVFGWLFLGEALTIKKAAGCLLVVAGLWLLKF